VWHPHRMNTSTPTNRYKNHRFPAEIMSHGVWLYYRCCLSYRDVEGLLCEDRRGRRRDPARTSRDHAPRPRYPLASRRGSFNALCAPAPRERAPQRPPPAATSCPRSSRAPSAPRRAARGGPVRAAPAGGRGSAPGGGGWPGRARAGTPGNAAPDGPGAAPGAGGAWPAGAVATPPGCPARQATFTPPRCGPALARCGCARAPVMRWRYSLPACRAWWRSSGCRAGAGPGRTVRELVFALDAAAAGQQQWRALAREAARRGKRGAGVEPAAYGEHKALCPGPRRSGPQPGGARCSATCAGAGQAPPHGVG
jgi:hypothetical protein